MKRFLCTLEFRSGEHGVPFYHIVKARAIKSAESKIHNWLRQFYPAQFDERDRNTYYYIGGEVAIDIKRIEPLDTDKFINFITIN